MAEMYLELYRQLKPKTQLQPSLRSFKLESNKVESGCKPTEWIAEWHDYYHHLTAIGYYQGIGCNQAFMEAGHMILGAELIEMNYYKPSVTAAFIEAWCGYIAEHEHKLLEDNRRFQDFVRLHWEIKICWAKKEPIPYGEDAMQLVWKTQQQYLFWGGVVSLFVPVMLCDMIFAGRCHFRP